MTDTTKNLAHPLAIDQKSDGKTKPQLFENLITKKDLSEWLQVPAATVQDWCFKRQIPFVKVGRHVRFSPSEIKLWLQKRRHYD